MSPFWAFAIVSRCNPPVCLRWRSFFIRVFIRWLGLLPLSSVLIVVFSAHIASRCLRNAVIFLVLFLLDISGICVRGKWS